MKKSTAKTAILALVTILTIICLGACKKNQSIFYLDGKAVKDYYIVKAKDASSSANTAAFKVRMAIEEEFGVNMAYYFTTDEADKIVHKYEIIIGETSRFQEEDYPVKKADLGANGFFIKAIDSKIYIIGGTDEALLSACEYFISEFIAGKSKVEFSNKYEYVQEALFDIRNIYINMNNLKEYKIIYDDSDFADVALMLKQTLIEKAGIELSVEYVTDISTTEKSVILSNSFLPGEGFIRFAVEGDNLAISCNINEGIIYGVELFVKMYLDKATGSFNFPSGYIYSDIGDMIILMPEK